MTWWSTPAAGPHTGPATRKAPGGKGATTVDLPVPGSSTPTPEPPTNAISPCASPPATGDGERCTAATLLGLPHAASSTRAANAPASLGMDAQWYPHRVTRTAAKPFRLLRGRNVYLWPRSACFPARPAVV